MADESGRFRIVYNGEVHNYLELRRDLESAGHVFRSGGDTEVVLQAFVAWGEECFRRFNGMWALAVWDARDRALTLSRDRFGIKPLCVSRRGARLAFASEPKAILAAFPEEREPDRRELAAFLQGAVPDGTEATFFRNIRTIPPDSVVRIEGGKQTRRKFWGFTPGEDRPRPDSVEAFSELFGDATALRLRSDVPVGACLSGGMDSSAIVARAAPRLPGGMDCFSLLYPGAPCDESRFAAAVAEAMPTCRLHWVEPDASDLLATMERIVWHHDAPAPLRGRYPQWYVFGAASRHVRVVLDGQGGDEMLGGYQPKDVMRRALASELPAKIVERRDKKGFPAPMTQWLRRPDCVRQWRALLLSAAALERGVFDAQRLRGALDRFERDARFAARCTEALWRWINVELWFRLFS
jgi:asparagine synthase (glutamine-hydrolysing)